MTDFNAIFQPQTDAQIQAAKNRDATNQTSQQLYQSLERGDFSTAGKMLLQAGSCQWDSILKGDVTKQSDNSHRFPAHLSMGKDQTSIEIIERFPGNYKKADTFVPRLTVTDDNCDKKQKK